MTYNVFGGTLNPTLLLLLTMGCYTSFLPSIYGSFIAQYTYVIVYVCNIHTIQFISSIETVIMSVAFPQLRNALSTDAASEIVFRTLRGGCSKCI